MKTIFLYCFCLIVNAQSITYAALGDIGTFTSVARTYSTASYWIEGADGVVMIDTQFLPKEGIQAIEVAEKATGKKVTTAIVLHPNPDKFNGTSVFQQRGIKVLTSTQVKALIPAVHDIRYGWFFDEYAPDYPKNAAQPDVFGSDTMDITVHGITLKLHVMARGASNAHVVAQYKDNLFVGDLINPNNHAWLELGYVTDWLARLEEIRALKPTTIYPGRGAVGGPALIDVQSSYLKFVQTAVRDSKPKNELSWFTKWRLQSKIEGTYPHLGYPIFMRDGLGAVWALESAAPK